MEHIRRILPVRILVLVVLQASSVLVLLDSQGAADTVPSLRLEMTHVDSLMDTTSLHSPERLRRAAQTSIRRAQAFARQAQLAYSSRAFSQALLADSAAHIHSSGTGAYLVELALGTPPQSFNGVFDTGSDLVWRQSSPCLDCFQETDPLFDPSSSSTYETMSCTDAFCIALPAAECTTSVCIYEYTYGDGSTTFGILSNDTLTVGGSSIEGFVFGAGNDNYGAIAQVGTDGIIGMGGGPLSLVSQWSSTIENKFSYCLVAWEDAPSKTSPLLFGSSAALSGADVISTPLITSSKTPTFYYLGLKGISFNGQLLSIPPGTFDLQADGSGGVIIDSGTTVTILVDDGYTPIRDAYSAVINLPPVNGSSLGLDLCYDNSGNATVSIPLLTFHFDGADVELPVGNTFIEAQPGYLCLAFIRLDPSLGMTINIYGNIQQQNFQILYDKGPANQLSFKPTNCETL